MERRRKTESVFFRGQKPSRRFAAPLKEEDGVEDEVVDPMGDTSMEDEGFEFDFEDEGEQEAVDFNDMDLTGYIVTVEGGDFEVVADEGTEVEIRDAEGETKVVDKADLDEVVQVEEVVVTDDNGPVRIGDIIANVGDTIIIQSPIIGTTEPEEGEESEEPEIDSADEDDLTESSHEGEDEEDEEAEEEDEELEEKKRTFESRFPQASAKRNLSKNSVPAKKSQKEEVKAPAKGLELTDNQKRIQRILEARRKARLGKITK